MLAGLKIGFFWVIIKCGEAVKEVGGQGILKPGALPQTEVWRECNQIIK